MMSSPVEASELHPHLVGNPDDLHERWGWNASGRIDLTGRCSSPAGLPNEAVAVSRWVSEAGMRVRGLPSHIAHAISVGQ